ncbi:hypothetical protein ACFST9_17135 [Hymenobacter monticola]|uniref:Uncharacterized protein n=1 Tax=Hymenobacter monticola TaxID=1705399 RepID=A0ABY4AZQ5_9BACT|nr:hypothetical protein [Hymenobacter monticola]UOE32367.1 hypothetical protein MTP16_14645 [Hymenobacter monticola]
MKLFLLTAALVTAAATLSQAQPGSGGPGPGTPTTPVTPTDVPLDGGVAYGLRRLRQRRTR